MVHCEIRHRGDIPRSVRQAERMGQLAGIDIARLPHLKIVVTELGTNLLRHTPHGGVLLLRTLDPGPAGVEVMAYDEGPGTDLSTALRDGYSESGRGGSGLGAIQRLSDAFDAHSSARGTCIIARLLAEAKREPPLWVATRPRPGEIDNGDGWGLHQRRDGWRLVVVDGLGHGTEASRAAQAALTAAKTAREAPLAELFEAAHEAARSTRGVALTVADLVNTSSLRVMGVGNVMPWLVTEGGERIGITVSPGVVGGRMPRRLKEQVVPTAAGHAVVIHTDGIDRRWPVRGTCAKTVLSAFIDHQRPHDDATVVGFRQSLLG